MTVGQQRVLGGAQPRRLDPSSRQRRRCCLLSAVVSHRSAHALQEGCQCGEGLCVGVAGRQRRRDAAVQQARQGLHHCQPHAAAAVDKREQLAEEGSTGLGAAQAWRAAIGASIARGRFSGK